MKKIVISASNFLLNQKKKKKSKKAFEESKTEHFCGLEDTLLGTDYNQPSTTPCTSSTEKSASTIPSTDPLQFILAWLHLMQRHFTSLETTNSSATSREVTTAESALV